MANPIPYNNLFDIDGLKMAIKECETESDRFGTAATEDFKRINSVVKALRKELEALGVTMSKPIKLMDDSGQEQIRNLARQVSDLTNQFNTQKAAIDALKNAMNANRQAISDAKVQAAQYEAQLRRERVVTQELRSEIARQTLETRRQAEATREAARQQTAATGSYREAQNRLRELGKAIREAEGGFRATSPQIRNQIRDYNTLNDALKRFDASMGNHQRNVGNYGSALGNIGGQLKSLAMGYLSITAALAAATATFNTALSQDATRASLEFTLQSTDLAKAKMKELAVTANRLGVDFNALTKTYASFAGAAKAANFPLDQTNKIFNSVTGAAARFHLSADQLSGSLLAIQQMISKGTVQSEELRGQLGERLPGAFSIAARAMGVTEQELGKLLKSGDVLASDLLPKLATELDKTFSLDKNTKIDSLTASWERFKNTFSESVDDNSNIKTFFGGLIDGISVFSDSILKLVNSSSWGEFWNRIKSFAAAGRGDFASMFTNFFVANKQHESSDPVSVAVNDFMGKSRKEQISDIETLTVVSRRAYEEAKKGNKEDIKYYNEQNRILAAISQAYKNLYKTKKQVAEVAIVPDAELTSISEIRKRITELSKMPNSAINGSEVNNRIDALKKRLHDLTAAVKQTKSGFDLLEEQIKKTLLLLQDSIVKDDRENGGVQTKHTLELAAAYQELIDKLQHLKNMQARAEIINLFGKDGKPPVLQAVGGGTVDAGGLSTALTTSALTTELENTQRDLEAIQDKYAKANQEIFKTYRDRKITLNQYNEEIQLSQDKAADEVFEKEKHLADLRIQLAISGYGKNSKEYRSALKALGDLQDKYNKDSLTRDERLYAARKKLQDETIALLQKTGQSIGRLTGNQGLGSLFGDIGSAFIGSIDAETNKFSEIKLNFEQTAALGMDAVNTYTEFMIQASERRIAQLNKEKEHDLALAGNNAEAKTKIEEEYNNKVTEEKRKQATLSKISALAEIAINTAVAVTKTAAVTGPLAFLLAPALIALGAVQAAIVLATPIPQYEKGRTDGAAEYAEVNERGPELIGQRGKWRLANRGMRGVTFLNKGDQVKTATDTKQMLANGMITQDGQYVTNVSQSKSIYDQYIMATSRANNIDYGLMAGAVADGVSGLPVTEHNYNERGYQTNLRVKNTRIMDINRRNRF